MIVDAATLAVAAAVVQLVCTIGGGFYFMGKVTQQLGTMQRDVTETKSLVTSSAVHESRLTRVEDDLRGLRRGVGWINDAAARTVDREY